MPIFLTVLILTCLALALVILRRLVPGFRYPWLLAVGAAVFSLVSLLVWKFAPASGLSLPAWQPQRVYVFVPWWTVDGISWPLSTALCALAAAVVLTSVVRNENEPLSWAWTLFFTALGILAVSAGNPLTLAMTWAALDACEFLVLMRSPGGADQSRGILLAFGIRLAGIFLLLWGTLTSDPIGGTLRFETVPGSAGFFLVLAACLRLGALPLQLPDRKENILPRGFGTCLRLVCALAGIVLLARVPAQALDHPLRPLLLLLACAGSCAAGWMWLRASDEVLGRSYFVLGVSALAVISCLGGSALGSTGWGIALVLSGAALFLFSARQRNVTWLPLLGLWALSALPFSVTASAWQGSSRLYWLILIPALPAQSLLMAGVIRHALHPGETSLESQEKWVKGIYPTGLLLPIGISLALGMWGWPGAALSGRWAAGLVGAALTAAFTLLGRRMLLPLPGPIAQTWARVRRFDLPGATIKPVTRFLGSLTNMLTASLEGEGGLLWSLLLLVLILSLLATGLVGS